MPNRKRKNRQPGRDEYDPLAPVIPISLTIPAADFGWPDHGIAQAMIQANGGDTNAELLAQDEEQIKELDNEFKEESFNVSYILIFYSR